MKTKTSVSLSKPILDRIRKLPGRPTRSEVIEDALVLYFKKREGLERDQKDREILERHADRLNKEAAEILEFQAES